MSGGFGGFGDRKRDDGPGAVINERDIKAALAVKEPGEVNQIQLGYQQDYVRRLRRLRRPGNLDGTVARLVVRRLCRLVQHGEKSTSSVHETCFHLWEIDGATAKVPS